MNHLLPFLYDFITGGKQNSNVPRLANTFVAECRLSSQGLSKLLWALSCSEDIFFYVVNSFNYLQQEGYSNNLNDCFPQKLQV